MALNFVATLNSNPFLAGTRAMQGAVAGLGRMLGPLVALTAGFVGVAGAASAVRRSISEAADMEEMRTNFVTLLGSVDAAQERMEYLANFAGRTPFDLPGAAQASRTLETLTRGALSTGAGLTLVGDVASGTGVGFAEMATTVGRLYDGLQSGRAVGEAMARLQELGVITGETRGQLEAMQAAGQKGDAVWEVASAALGRFSGNMERQSSTWKGIMANLEDGIGAVFREFGTPLMDTLKPALSGLADLVDGLAPKARAFGETLASGIGIVTNAFRSGQISDLLGLSLQIGFTKAINFLMAGMRGVAAFAVSAMSTLPERLSAAFSVLMDLKFWDGLNSIFSSIGNGLVAAIASGLSPVVNKLIELLNKIPGVEIDFDADGMAEIAKDAAARDWEQGSSKMKSALSPLLDTAANHLSSAVAAARSAVEGAPEFMQTGPLMTSLTALYDGLKPLTAIADAATKASDKSAQSGDSTLVMPRNQTSRSAADAYAKIGLFIGGSAASEAQRTRSVISGFQRSMERAMESLITSVRDRVDATSVWA